MARLEELGFEDPALLGGPQLPVRVGGAGVLDIVGIKTRWDQGRVGRGAWGD